MIEDFNLKGVFAYLDDITVCGNSVEEHDENSLKFVEAAHKVGLSINAENPPLVVNLSQP